MKTYHVSLQLRTPEGEPDVHQTVTYQTDEYPSAWVGSRTVCRLGTAFRDEGAKTPREFYTPEGKKFPVAAGAWTVRRIFIKNTRKKGVRRMTTLTGEQLVDVIKNQDIKITAKLHQALLDVLGDSQVTVTVATARRLGLVVDNLPPPLAEEERAA